MRSTALLITIMILSPAATDAALLVYEFDSATNNLHGEITFEDSNGQFAAGGTVSTTNGGIVDYFFTNGTAYWDLNDQRDTLFISFGSGGTSPDDINFYGLNTVDDAPQGNTGLSLNFNTDNTANGSHTTVVGSSGARDGTFSVSDSASSVPEPASLWLLSGAAVWGIARQRRRRRNSPEPVSSESL